VPEKLKLGELLVAEGLIEETQLRAALGEQARWGHRLGETLVRMGFLSEADLVRTLSRRFGVPGVDLHHKALDPEVIDRVPAEVAEKYLCLPLFTKRQGGVELLYLGMDDPTNLTAVDDVSFRTGLGVRPVLLGPIQLREAIDCYYHGEGPAPGDLPAIAEAPLRQDDTAPVVPLVPAEESEFLLEELAEEPSPEQAPGVASDAAPAAPGSRSVPTPAAPAEPREADLVGGPAAPVVPAAPVRAAGEEAPATAKPREVPTRQILQALTRVLLDKGLLTREELMLAVRDVRRETPDA
jgi:type IV pilus assembly protein PilB